MSDSLDRPYRALQLALGTAAVAAGADKFFNLLTDWEQYLNDDVSDRLGLSPKQLMSLVGLVEIAAGATVLSGRTRFGGIDIAVRDINMAVAAYALAELAQRRQRRIKKEDIELERAA